MNILLYRYYSICEPTLLKGFAKLGHTVTEITEQVYNKNLSPQAQIKTVSDYLFKDQYDLVFSINFFPVLAEVCNIFKIPYVCWIVDSPVMELYSDAILRPYNRIFMFDRAMYEKFVHRNPNCIFYYPLGADVEGMQEICATITSKDKKEFSADISFVGSLYSEKCPYNAMANPSPYLKGYLEGLIEAQLKVYGYNFLEEVVNEKIIAEFKKAIPYFYEFPEKSWKDEKGVMADFYIGNKVTEQERIRLLNALSQRFSVDLYTGSDTSGCGKVNNRGMANSLLEMPKIFQLSKINLNFTSKPIRTGLPLRIWDIMACGGFVMSNYQSEIPEYFTIGEEIETYASEEELIDKCDYYLKHEEERRKIAQNGFEKVKKEHTTYMRLDDILHNI